MLIGVGAATAIALVGSERWYARVERLPYLGRALRGLGRLGAFYDRHPPKPLLFYVFYPLLLPVVLFRPVPRAELLLYRRVSAIAIIAIVATGTWDYFAHWRPELTCLQFAGTMVGVFVIELVATFLLVMPVVTTLVLLRAHGRMRTLALLVAIAIGTAVFGVHEAHHRRAMSIMTWFRLDERTHAARAELRACVQAHPDGVRDCVHHDRALRALADALDAARASAGDRDAALAAARDKLAEYYKPDEADAFRLLGDDDVLVVYARYARKPAIWLGNGGGHWLVHPQDLPEGLRRALGI
jgi:hypothetical protein